MVYLDLGQNVSEPKYVIDDWCGGGRVPYGAMGIDVTRRKRADVVVVERILSSSSCRSNSKVAANERNEGRSVTFPKNNIPKSGRKALACAPYVALSRGALSLPPSLLYRHRRPPPSPSPPRLIWTQIELWRRIVRKKQLRREICRPV